ncbi:MAG: hypothetical protein MR357_07855, partial [Anaeroplasma sp.]|nr:hypothetical protein [Anaeroplasma sp.]
MAALGLAVTSSISTTYAYTPDNGIVQAMALSANQTAHQGPKIDVTHLEGIDPATVRSGQEFEYMGLKYMWMGDRWYLENVDDPASVETIVIPDDMAGYGCAVAYLKFEEYTNLKNVYLFDNSNWYSHIASLELENLYLCTHLDLNSKYQGLTVKNLYLCCPYDAYYLSPSPSTKTGMSSYNVTNWYYASFMEDYFNDVAESWRNYEECPINFQKVDMGTLGYDETEFYPYAGYLHSFTKSGVKYQTYNSSTGLIVADSTQYRILDFDSRVKSVIFPGKMTGLNEDFKQHVFEYLDARGTSTNSLEYISAISNSGSAFYPSRMYSGLQKLYCVYDADSRLDISSIYGGSTMSAS